MSWIVVWCPFRFGGSPNYRKIKLNIIPYSQVRFPSLLLFLFSGWHLMIHYLATYLRIDYKSVRRYVVTPTEGRFRQRVVTDYNLISYVFIMSERQIPIWRSDIRPLRGEPPVADVPAATPYREGGMGHWLKFSEISIPSALCNCIKADINPLLPFVRRQISAGSDFNEKWEGSLWNSFAVYILFW